MLNETDWDSILTTHDLNEIVNKFTYAIIKSANAAIPNKMVTIRPQEPKWISCDIKRQIRQRKSYLELRKGLIMQRQG